MSKAVEKRLIADFTKSFSCAYATARVLSKSVGLDEDEYVLRAVVGFSSGVAAMGDTCGAVSSATIILSQRFRDLPSAQLYSLCFEYYRRLEERLGPPNCGSVHGGKHLARDLRRALLTGKTRQCTRILKESSRILEELAIEVEQGRFPAPDDHITAINRYFEDNSFHCAQSTIGLISLQTGLPAEHILGASRGFCGGIGCNGTLCGAIAGAILCLGLMEDVDLSRSGYRNTMMVILFGLIKSGRIFQDKKRFLPAELFTRCRDVYQTVEDRYGGAHCRDILGLELNTEEGVRRYVAENKMERCRDIVQLIADKTGMP